MRHPSKTRWDKARPKRGELSPEALTKIREQNRLDVRRFRERRKKAIQQSRENGENIPRAPGSFIRSRRFPRKKDYLAEKHGLPMFQPSRSMLWRPWVRPDYWGKPEETLFVRTYRQHFTRPWMKLPSYFTLSVWFPSAFRLTSLYANRKRTTLPERERIVRREPDRPQSIQNRPRLELQMDKSRSEERPEGQDVPRAASAPRPIDAVDAPTGTYPAKDPALHHTKRPRHLFTGELIEAYAPSPPYATPPPRDVRPGRERVNALGMVETELEREARNQRLLNHPDPVIRAHLRAKAGLNP